MPIPSNFPVLRFVTARRVTPKAVGIRWAIMPTDYPLDDVVYQIFRSQGAAGPWEAVGAVEQGVYHWTDHDVHAPWTGNLFYYVLRASSISGKGFRDSEPIYLTHDPDHIAMEMIRKKDIFLRHRSGVPISVFNKKSWGAYCGRCWDPVRRLPRDPDCPECYGSGFTGGYTAAYNTFALMQPRRELLIRTPAPVQEGTAYAEIGPNPYVDPGDLLVDRVMNLRYRINAVQQASHRMYVVSQILTLSAVDENDVVYKIPVAEPEDARIGMSYAAGETNA